MGIILEMGGEVESLASGVQNEKLVADTPLPEKKGTKQYMSNRIGADRTESKAKSTKRPPRN